MRKLILFILIAVSLVFTEKVSAQMDYGMMMQEDDSGVVEEDIEHSRELDEVIQEILDLQNLQSKEDLDCDKVTNEQFEIAGEAWMGIMVPNETAHEQMDRMMGGEESESLKEAHIRMGQNYLGCSENGRGMGMMPMMNGMNNNIGGGGFPMMSFGGYGNMMGGFGIFFSIFWIVVLIDLILFGVWLWKQIQKK